MGGKNLAVSFVNFHINLKQNLKILGIVACGVFLLFIAIVGLYGAIKQHQVALFFYMVVLFSIFVIQFSVACASLAASTEDELEIMEKVRIHFNT